MIFSEVANGFDPHHRAASGRSPAFYLVAVLTGRVVAYGSSGKPFASPKVAPGRPKSASDPIPPPNPAKTPAKIR